MNFPFLNPDDFGVLEDIAARAGIELRGDEYEAVHCGEVMHVKQGIMGPDYAKCRECGVAIGNMGSPHINGGIVLKEAVYTAFGEQMWTILRA